MDAGRRRVRGRLLALVAHRHPESGPPAVRERVARQPLIDVDLHMHTDHSHDCATPVELLLSTARERGLGAIAVTDHNEISGALRARELAAEHGVKVIVGEEIKTGGQGEVIGLFIEEKIPRGLTLQETIDEIHRQGGLVYVPHPFDRLHSVPDYEHLLGVVDDVDAPGGVQTRASRSRRTTRKPCASPPSTGSGGRGLRLPRRPGPRLGPHPDARLRRAGGVP
jgi:hypothetical protein